ncbi:MAG: 50S ribosomal protein L11 methyltransferase [Vicinamibacterales bacterium]
MDPSPALVLQLNGVDSSTRERLVALLADFELVAVQEDDLTAPRVWITHFSSPEDRDAAAAAVRGVADFDAVGVAPSDVEDEDWARRTQADLPAVRIGTVIIAPPWDLPKPSLQLPNPNTTIVIEPSRGFGTGHHQSTRLCIVLLQSRNLSGLRVIDVGTGSGVLAITAARLGAAFVTAIDTDPDAVENARENIVANAVEQTVEAHVGDLETTTLQPADLVTANLTGTLLSLHAADLARLVRPGGSVIVSGFNIDEKPRVTEALSAQFTLSETAEEDDWFAFVVTK